MDWETMSAQPSPQNLKMQTYSGDATMETRLICLRCRIMSLSHEQVWGKSDTLDENGIFVKMKFLHKGVKDGVFKAVDKRPAYDWTNKVEWVGQKNAEEIKWG